MVDRRARLTAAVAALVLTCGACGGAGAASAPEATARLLFVGDAMLGRGVAPVAAGDPGGLFVDVRRIVRDADVAAVNLESPLTDRPHTSANPFELEADPEVARLLAAAGFDVASIANNHAGDAGPASVTDSVAALRDSGVVPVGGGADVAEATAMRVVELDGVTVGYLAFDASGQGLAATDDAPGIAAWDDAVAARLVTAARAAVDVVTVSIHGGVAYRQATDPLLEPVADLLARWGADIVWGHGPHVEQPITVVDPDGDGRPTVVATSLGNFLFDQQTPATNTGAILEVLVDRHGVIAHRVGGKHHDDLRVHFTGWREPDGAAALMQGSWWALDRGVGVHRPAADRFPFSDGDVVDASSGDLDVDGVDEVLVSFRHLVRDRAWDLRGRPAVDESGRSAHLGVVGADGSIMWMSRRPPHPVGAVAACDGSAAFAYTTLDATDIVATGAGTWSGFGFVVGSELPGPGSIGCSDVDRDGRTDPVVVRGSTP